MVMCLLLPPAASQVLLAAERRAELLEPCTQPLQVVSCNVVSREAAGPAAHVASTLLEPCRSCSGIAAPVLKLGVGRTNQSLAAAAAQVQQA